MKRPIYLPVSKSPAYRGPGGVPPGPTDDRDLSIGRQQRRGRDYDPDGERGQATQQQICNYLGLRASTQHCVLHRGVERHPGLPQLRGERRAELRLKAPHQRLTQCGILRWLHPKSGVLAT